MSAIMSDQSKNENVAELFSPGPGERLRAARLSMGYDLPKMAAELHLTSAVVEALEADDFRDIGARVFVRGYLRNYARVVGMPVDSILRQFDETWPEDDGARKTMVRESPSLPADGAPGRGWAGAITWVLIIGIAVLFLMWWRGYLDELVPAQMRSTDPVPEIAPAQAPLLEDLPAALSVDEVDAFPANGSLRLPPPPPETTDADSTETGAVSSAAPSLVVPADDTLLPVPAPATVPTELAVPAAAQSTRAAPAPSTAVGPAVTDDGGAPVVEAGQQIIMTFSAPCWVDVRDQERKFKLFGEMPKGARKVLGGQPPYKMVIGNARAVTITVNGVPFDLTRYAKGNVARFTLDP